MRKFMQQVESWFKTLHILHVTCVFHTGRTRGKGPKAQCWDSWELSSRNEFLGRKDTWNELVVCSVNSGDEEEDGGGGHADPPRYGLRCIETSAPSFTFRWSDPRSRDSNELKLKAPNMKVSIEIPIIAHPQRITLRAMYIIFQTIQHV